MSNKQLLKEIQQTFKDAHKKDLEVHTHLFNFGCCSGPNRDVNKLHYVIGSSHIEAVSAIETYINSTGTTIEIMSYVNNSQNDELELILVTDSDKSKNLFKVTLEIPYDDDDDIFKFLYTLVYDLSEVERVSDDSDITLAIPGHNITASACDACSHEDQFFTEDSDDLEDDDSCGCDDCCPDEDQEFGPECDYCNDPNEHDIPNRIMYVAANSLGSVVQFIEALSICSDDVLSIEMLSHSGSTLVCPQEE